MRNILALRGDPPRGQTNWTKCDNGFSYAVDLVKYIRQEYGDYFCISVAGYPEGHIDNPDKDADLKYLKAKIDAGADYIVTQLFYDVDMFLDWVKKLRAMGITCPILPGIMPIQSYNGFIRMTTLCKTAVPQSIHDASSPIKDDDQAVKDYGVKLAVEMCRKLRSEGGLLGFHFYTLNLEKSVRLILEGLEFIADVDVAKPLPFNPSLHESRAKENVRPIFWKNRPRSYVARTEAWDEFPNGRWGDSRSPAYGELDGYGISLKYTREEALNIWKEPKSPQDVIDLFTGYCQGEVRALPWGDQPLSRESECIQDQLIFLNRSGFLTINSQPAVNGVPSNHPVFGWGPKNGYIYQKAYLEFFVDGTKLHKLIAALDKYEKEQGACTITFYAVNKSGTLLANNAKEKSEVPNAVTWGVFPGKEIVQPTVVEKESFLAWKDEAFQIWNEWASIYSEDSPAHSVLTKMSDEYYLANLVENDYIKGDLFRVFSSIFDGPVN